MRRLAPAAAVLALLVLPGCHVERDKPAVDPSALAPLPPANVGDAEFAGAVHRLLREGATTRERSALLSGAIRRQLVHAGEAFESGDAAAGARAVLGGVYLMRLGEGRADMLDASSSRALTGAIEFYSGRGDEGRTLAMARLLRGVASPGSVEARRLDEHMAALARWIDDTRSGGPMRVLSSEERRAVARALVEPSREALEQAEAAVSKSVARAVEINLEFQETRQLPSREEAIAAFSSLQSGAYVMAALYLRHGMAKEALAAIEGSPAGRVTRPSFFSKLRAAAVDDTAEDWRVLARDLARANLDDEEDETHLDPEVLGAALWGAALEAYRRDPHSLAVAHILAGHLADHGLAEVAPLVLADALDAKPSAAVLSGTLELIVSTLAAEPRDGKNRAASNADARRTFASAAPLLALADAAAYRGQLRTSASQVRQLMGSIELDAGNFDAARALFAQALAAEPSVWGYTTLAALERQLGQVDGALTHVAAAFALPEASAQKLDTAHARLLSFEIHRDRGARTEAKASLDAALALVLASRGTGKSHEHDVRAEELLAQVLDGYGKYGDAARAVGRALELADPHRSVLPATMLTAMSRALVRRDVHAARAALGRGIRADASPEALTYAAVWLTLLERQLGERPDGKADRVLADAVNGRGWTQKLARWAIGAIDDAGLAALAKSPSELLEAAFYAAMRAPEGAARTAALRAVATSPLIQHVEVRLARELTVPAVEFELPQHAALP